ncbi:hypothetical protein, partial [Saccharopolyspora sp. NPDC002686]|uniref:hypothetical protein n=1 Tax=Saccharopolyspora sp. NPDC002686 TaxID=3154541 RepID=UPI0033190458
QSPLCTGPLPAAARGERPGSHPAKEKDMHSRELSDQSVELLPARDALSGGGFGVGDIAIVNQLNVIVAVNIGGDIGQAIDASNVADIDFN